jgi:hypothetical protein
LSMSLAPVNRKSSTICSALPKTLCPRPQDKKENARCTMDLLLPAAGRLCRRMP